LEAFTSCESASEVAAWELSMLELMSSERIKRTHISIIIVENAKLSRNQE
jgi:ribosomal protein L20A (L18A)